MYALHRDMKEQARKNFEFSLISLEIEENEKPFWAMCPETGERFPAHCAVDLQEVLALSQLLEKQEKNKTKTKAKLWPALFKFLNQRHEVEDDDALCNSFSPEGAAMAIEAINIFLEKMEDILSQKPLQKLAEEEVGLYWIHEKLEKAGVKELTPLSQKIDRLMEDASLHLREVGKIPELIIAFELIVNQKRGKIMKLVVGSLNGTYFSSRENKEWWRLFRMLYSMPGRRKRVCYSPYIGFLELKFHKAVGGSKGVYGIKLRGISATGAQASVPWKCGSRIHSRLIKDLLKREKKLANSEPELLGKLLPKDRTVLVYTEDFARVFDPEVRSSGGLFGISWCEMHDVIRYHNLSDLPVIPAACIIEGVLSRRLKFNSLKPLGEVIAAEL